MFKLIRDFIVVSIVSVVIFMLGVANVLTIVFGLIRTLLESTMSPIAFYNHDVAAIVAMVFSVTMVLSAVLTFALLWRYGRPDSGATIRGDLQALRMKWDLRRL